MLAHLTARYKCADLQGALQDLDPSNENRTLVYTGPLARQDTKGWTDFEAGLLDNYR